MAQTEKEPKDHPQDEGGTEIEEVDQSDYRCGVLGWRPKWLQCWATSKGFIVMLGLLGTVQGMSFLYFIGTLTTIEKRFGIQSKTTGWMLSGNEISQILMSPILSYFGGQGNRPVWIAWGVICSALSCFVLASPHFFFGSGPDALALTEEYGGSNPTLLNMSLADNDTNSLGMCTGTINEPDCSPGEEMLMAPLLIFLSQFILGIGTTLYYSLGQPYLDDNSKKSSTPMLLGLTMSLRTIGPSFGFIVTYFCLSTFINPTLTPIINSRDPRWLGAWWLGWVILGSVMLVIGVLIGFFPKKLPKKQKPKDQEALEPLNQKPDGVNGKSPPPVAKREERVLKGKDYLKNLKKLLKNKLLIVNLFAGVFYILGASGYMTFMTRNMEVQWYETSASANIVIGPLMVGAMMIGFLLSGWAISHFKPRPAVLFSWNVVLGLVSVCTQLSNIWLACPDVEMAGYDPVAGTIDFNNTCNMGCGCEGIKFSPVCHAASNMTFFSPCHAGCTASSKNGQITTYSNCSCVSSLLGTSNSSHFLDDSSLEYSTFNETLTNGWCLPPCLHIRVLYLAISFLGAFLGSTGKIGNVLINYRAVDPEEKSFAAGISIFLVSLFAFIPGPVLYGYILDSTCLVWDTSCGRDGQCWFYDRTRFRLLLNGTAAAFTFTGAMLDAIVCYLGRNVNLYYDDEDEKKAVEEKRPSIYSFEKLPEKEKQNT